VASCFGLYEYLDVTDVPFQSRFKAPLLLNGQPWPVSYYASPSNGLEWTINNVTALRTLYVADSYTRPIDPMMSWTFLTQVYAGSTGDATIGGDFIPSATDYIDFTFPCYSCCPYDKNDLAGGTFLPKDVCGVCGGDGSSCATSSTGSSVVASTSASSSTTTTTTATTATETTTETATTETATTTATGTPTKPACPACRQDAPCGPGYVIVPGQIDANGCTTCERCAVPVVHEESAGAAVRVALASLLFVGVSSSM